MIKAEQMAISNSGVLEVSINDCCSREEVGGDGIPLHLLPPEGIAAVNISSCTESETTGEQLPRPNTATTTLVLSESSQNTEKGLHHNNSGLEVPQSVSESKKSEAKKDQLAMDNDMSTSVETKTLTPCSEQESNISLIPPKKNGLVALLNFAKSGKSKTTIEEQSALHNMAFSDPVPSSEVSMRESRSERESSISQDRARKSNLASPSAFENMSKEEQLVTTNSLPPVGQQEAQEKKCNRTYSSEKVTSNVALDTILKFTRPLRDESTKNWVKLNIGGLPFITLQSTLDKFPQTRLGALTKTDSSYDKDKDEYTFDFNPLIFQNILDFYRFGNLHFPNSICGPAIKNALNFWKIDENVIESCCWDHYKLHSELQETLDKLETSFKTTEEFDPDEQKRNAPVGRLRRARMSLWYFFENPKSSIFAQVYAVLSVLLIIFCIMLVALDTVADYRVSTNISRLKDPNETNHKRVNLETTLPHPVMFGGDVFVACIFGAELLLRTLACPSIKRLYCSFFTWLDIIVVLSQWFNIALAFSDDFHMNPALRTMYDICMVLRVVRIFLLFKLARHYEGLQVLLIAVTSSAKELALLVAFMLFGMVTFATLVFYAEFEVPDAFEDIPTAFWWAMITMTTVGYGDVYPVTNAGYLVAVLCALSGVLITALPIPIIANNFATTCKVAQMRKRIAKKQTVNLSALKRSGIGNIMFLKKKMNGLLNPEAKVT